MKKEDGKAEPHAYTLFVDFTSQKNLELSQFHFPSLVEHGKVKKARACFSEYWTC
ncbi:hypothetical protein ACFSYG_06400 [Leeuwenhoekiella polynyae]|uniref:hypothetical protein n=1 Tax=Leeuwenhoekiella polynyae TaxID=1550906 RepID=UPI0013E8A01C|nr:hypothetical protein [Leeuwenhoekiella polynyae]